MVAEVGVGVGSGGDGREGPIEEGDERMWEVQRVL